MRKIVTFLFVALFVVGSAYAGNGPKGSAPNSGDGIPDGSGFPSGYGSWK